MYPIPPTETLVQTKICRHCSALFPITDKDLEFYEKVSPVFPTPLSFEGEGLGVRREWYKVRYLIPTPTLCPDCRQQRRLSFRNERKLYKRKCDATNKDIISIYSPDKPFKVYHQDYWWSDKWDPMEYGRDFDFSRWFFEQFGELLREIPQLSLVNLNPENSEYTNGWVWNKNCYMIFVASHNQDCYFGYWLLNTENLMDCSYVSESSECYECVDIEKCTNCFFSERLESSSDCYHCSDCIGCTFCIDCHDLRNKSYMIRNIQVSPEQFKQELQQIPLNRLIHKRSIVKSNTITNCDNVIGDNVSNSKNSFLVFWGKEWQDIKYVNNFSDLRDSYDVNSQAYDCSRIYESYGIEHINNCIVVYLSVNVVDLQYSMYCFDSKNCFWCIGLRNKSYCILNKQYTREEYETLVPRIIEHMSLTPNPSPFGGEGGMEWWEFFPSILSPFGYNETVAMEYYPLTREAIIPPTPLSKGGQNNNIPLNKGDAEWNGAGGFIHWPVFNWSDYEAPFPKVEKIIPADKLPDDIASIPDDILNWAIECEVTKKPFRIIKQELEFYRKHYLPIPRRHPDQRHLDRMALRNPRKLFERKCDKCGKDMITTYALERKERVYCEFCYEKEVIW